MDVLTAIKERRACRKLLPDPVNDEVIRKILEAAVWAPSPLNSQPWEFIVITDEQYKKNIFSEGERCRQWALQESGWKWLGNYTVNFLQSAPVIIAVIGDPHKTGVDMFQEEGTVAYQHACAAAIQNMNLAACALGLCSLWYTLFDKNAMRNILAIASEKTPLALVCIGKPDGDVRPVPRKDVEDKTRYI